MSNIRRTRKRIELKKAAGTDGDLQDQITKLTGLTYEVTTALGLANDKLAKRVAFLEDAWKDAVAQAKKRADGQSGIITFGNN
jgi:hypothetical protein